MKISVLDLFFLELVLSYWIYKVRNSILFLLDKIRSNKKRQVDTYNIEQVDTYK